MAQKPIVNEKNTVSQEHQKPLKTQEIANRQFPEKTKNPLKKIKQYMEEETGLTAMRKNSQEKSNK